MKDNKIDAMCQKCGAMYTMLNAKEPNLEMIKSGLRQLQYDLELLRKCTLDNPDFKWEDDTSHGYTQAKSEAFRNE